MEKEGYEHLTEELEVDREKPVLQRFVEGAEILRFLGAEEIQPGHDKIYVGGPTIEQISYGYAVRLTKLGFKNYDDDMGWVFLT